MAQPFYSELPFENPTGCYYISKDGKEENLYFYYNFIRKSYYTGPIYSKSGHLAGRSVSKKALLSTMNEYIESGLFKEVDSHGNVVG